MLQQMVFKLAKEDKAFWSSFAQQMHCKDATEFVRKLTVVMRTTPVSEFREWFYTRLAKAESPDDAPIIRIVNSVIEQAMKDGANEIHFQPQRLSEPLVGFVEDKPFEINAAGGVALSVFFRIGGELREQARMPDYIHQPLVALIKNKANLNISEHDLPQSGSMTAQAGEEVRVWQLEVVPTTFGEKLVLQASQ